MNIPTSRLSTSLLLGIALWTALASQALATISNNAVAWREMSESQKGGMVQGFAFGLEVASEGRRANCEKQDDLFFSNESKYIVKHVDNMVFALDKFWDDPKNENLFSNEAIHYCYLEINFPDFANNYLYNARKVEGGNN